jgi:hypothetical protein
MMLAKIPSTGSTTITRHPVLVGVDKLRIFMHHERVFMQ